MEEERKASEPYFIGFMDRRYTNDDNGRLQEEMDIESDEERSADIYSHWGDDAAFYMELY